MKYMSGKAKIMVAGLAIGLAAAAVLAGLAVKGQIGFWGMAAVLFVAALAALAGWIIGIQMRVKIEKHRVWLEGYKDGQARAQAEIQDYCQRTTAVYWRTTPILEKMGR